MRATVRSVVAAATFGATLVVLLDSSNVWQRSDTEWHPGRYQVLAAVIVLALSSVYTLIDAQLERFWRNRRDSISLVAAEKMFPLWCGVADSFRHRAVRETLGVHVWLVPPWYAIAAHARVRDLIPAFIRKRLWSPQLWRAVQYRRRHKELATGISWRKGKGAIGLCWKTAATFHFDAVATWGAAQLSASDWHQLSESDRLGLSYHEYTKVRLKYGRVLAVPVFRPGGSSKPQFIGCIVVDVPPENLNSGPELNSLSIKNEIYAASSVLASSIDKRI